MGRGLPASTPQSDYKLAKSISSMDDKRLKFQKGKQKEFLEKVLENFDSQRELAQFLGIAHTTLRDWVKEKNNISKSKFYFVLESFPKYNIYKRFVEEELDWNWGWIKGGHACIAKRENLHDYLKYVRSFTRNKEQVPKSSVISIENNLLETLKHEDVDLLSILAVCTLTDGCLQKHGNSYRISFSSSDQVLINFIQALFFELSEYLPSTYGPSKGAYDTRVTDNKLGKRLLQLSPEYKTFASNPEKQPTISFLKNKNIQTKIWAMRFAFTADGCVFLPKNFKKSKPGLFFACCNKSVCVEWKDFLATLDIFGRVVDCKRYRENVSGVRIYMHQSIINFQELGGFVDKVKISRKSKYYCGLTKNAILAKVITTFG
jgi:hypothetical protein